MALVVALAFSQRAVANGSDYPAEIVMQGFVKPEPGRAHLLVRVPLNLLANVPLPKRGPGYLDLANIDAGLKQAAAATSRLVELSADGATLAPVTREVQLAFPADRSFASYATALAHLQGPPLPADTNLFWTQGYFDAHLEYALPSTAADLRVRVNVGPEVGSRLKLRLEYLPAGEPARPYEIAGNAGWIPLEPRGYETAWLFAKTGFAGAFAIDRFVFLLCLVAPFRDLRGVLALAVAMAALQALTATAAAEGAFTDLELGWLPLLANAVLAAAMILLAIGNLAAPSVRRRWLLATIASAFGGFGLARVFADAAQFAATHPLAAIVFFDVGSALGVVVATAVAAIALRVLFARVLGGLVGVIVLSALVGHAAWHGLIDNGTELAQRLQRLPGASLWPALGAVALWVSPALAVTIVAYLATRRWDGAPRPTLLRALQAHRVDARAPRV